MHDFGWYTVQVEGPGRAAAPPRPLLAVPNVTAHPSTASVPITVLLYDGLLLCGFNVAIKELMTTEDKRGWCSRPFVVIINAVCGTICMRT